MKWWESFPDLTKFMLEGPTDLRWPVYRKDPMADESEDYVVKQFTRSVQGLVESVKEMLAASRLLRGRIESNDHVLTRIENKHALLEERLGAIEKEVEQLRRASHVHPAQDHWRK